jgi:hypothetical protein
MDVVTIKETIREIVVVTPASGWEIATVILFIGVLIFTILSFREARRSNNRSAEEMDIRLRPRIGIRPPVPPTPSRGEHDFHITDNQLR